MYHFYKLLRNENPTLFYDIYKDINSYLSKNMNFSNENFDYYLKFIYSVD